MRLGIADLALFYLNKCTTDVRPVQLRFRRPGDAELVCQDATVVGHGNMMSGIKWRKNISAPKTARIARKPRFAFIALRLANSFSVPYDGANAPEQIYSCCFENHAWFEKNDCELFAKFAPDYRRESIICSAAKNKAAVTANIYG